MALSSPSFDGPKKCGPKENILDSAQNGVVQKLNDYAPSTVPYQ